MTLSALDSRFPDKRAVITGAASGVGLATAGLLAARGWHLALLDLDAARLASATEDLRVKESPHCEGFILDTTDEAGRQVGNRRLRRPFRRHQRDGRRA